MQIKLNGQPQSTNPNTLTLKDLLIEKELDWEGKGIAVAVNWSVVPKAEWETFLLKENDEIEVITARQGG